MNAYLREMLQQEARAVQPPPAPVDSIVGAGRRRLVRQRLVVGACAVAVAAVAMVVPASLRSSDTSAPPVVDMPSLGTLRMAWADANAIHFRGATTRRPDGLAFLASTPEMALWITMPDRTSWDGQLHGMDSDGRMYDLGAVWGPTIATNQAGTFAAWMRGGTDRREVVVYDTAAKEERAAHDVRPTGSFPADEMAGVAVAVDDATVWFESADLNAPGGGARAYSWSLGDDEPLALDLGTETLLVDVGPDVHARVRFEDGWPRLAFVDHNGDQVAAVEEVALGEFDPTGSYFVALRDSESNPSLELLDPDTGQPVVLSGMPGQMMMAGWDPSGALVAITTEAQPGWLHADDVLHLVGCRPDSNMCEELNEQPLTVADAPMVALSGYLGYMTAVTPIATGEPVETR